MEKYQDAIFVCDDAKHIAKVNDLQVDAKVLFRRGTANACLSNYEEAIDDLQIAQSLLPKENAIANKLRESKRLHEANRKREMKVYSKMFDHDLK